MLLTVATLWSCDNFLDVEPKGKAIPSTVEDYDLMLQYTSFGLKNAVYMDPDVYIPADALLLRTYDLSAYMWSANQYRMNESDGDWDGAYQTLYYCNQIIEMIDGASSDSGDEYQRRRIKGQAYAQRANIYFWLVNMYAKHYDALTMDTDLAVPMVVKNDLTQKLPRSTVAEIYALIESDLEIARDLVPETEDIKKNFRASKVSVDALLAKVELFKGNFTTALTYANSVIDAWGENFNDLNMFTSHDDYMNSFSPLLMSYGNPEFIWHTRVDVYPDTGTELGAIYLSDELDDLYIDNDLRYEFWTRGLDQNGNFYPENSRRFVNWYDKCMTASIPEMFLIRAECYSRSGNSGNVAKAVQDVNTLRKYRLKNGTSYELSASSLSDALNIVKQERRREFATTGLNWFDLRRYQAYGDPVDTYSRIVEGESYTLAPGSNRYIMAIPEFTRAYNPLLEQNPR
ncbi:RagB/SusD family nutrient uptake outer membrane protein [Labilibaculum manganireducens]|uniref:RagB/SusD family nutrient uptake outer membrane protein n=1 Tax=Labilibaculum manganireducens TaxID=1940525 RepID=UPI003747BBC3